MCTHIVEGVNRLATLGYSVVQPNYLHHGEPEMEGRATKYWHPLRNKNLKLWSS